MRTLPPGSVIGILGGGQLGRMTAQAAAKLGYHCHIFCSSPDEPAIEVAAFHTIASFDDHDALERFAKAVDVITLEWENVPLKALAHLEKLRQVMPGRSVLEIAQDREKEKKFARQNGVGTTDFAIVHSAAELQILLKTISVPAILKSTRLGYDGKGQVKIGPGMSANDAWDRMGGEVGILETFIDFSCEVSVIVARRADGASAVYPVVENIHRDQILFETHAPAALETATANEAEHVARRLAEKLDVVGLLAVEMFVLKTPNKEGQRVLMNEIAPRPHNSGHWTMDACSCSQFEQLVRAVCGLPLGSVTPHRRAVMRNLIGDEATGWSAALADTQASLHLYGKKDIKPGRKMGHVTFLKGVW